MNGERGISRIDSGSTHGWFVRGYRNGKTYTKLFSDKKNHTRFFALQMATKYRNELHAKLKEIPKQIRSRRKVVKLSRRNTSGVLGVSTITRNGIISYTVSWRPEPGVSRRTSFSTRKYGKKKAFKLACRYRKKMIRKAYGPNKS